MRRSFIVLILFVAQMGLGVQARAAHWEWVEKEVKPVPWDYTAFPMFMAFDKSDGLLTLVINDLDSGSVQVWKFTAPEWIKIWEGIPDLGEASPYYTFWRVYTLYYDEILNALVLWGHCPGHQFETNCEALFKYVPGEGLVMASECMNAIVSEMTDPVISSSFDSKRRRAVFVGAIGSFQPMQRLVTVEFDGTMVYYIPNSDDPYWDNFFAIGTTGYDPNSNRVVFYGQRYDGYPLETWEYDGQIWTLILTPTSPPAVHLQPVGLPYVPELMGLLALPNDWGTVNSWVYKGRQWNMIDTVKPFSGRVYGMLAYDPMRRAPVFYGGHDDMGEFSNRMWELKCVTHCKPLSES